MSAGGASKLSGPPACGRSWAWSWTTKRPERRLRSCRARAPSRGSRRAGVSAPP